MPTDTPSDAVLVLVVDPDPYTCALQEVLLGARYSAYFVADGREALELARRRHPRLVIADILVPGIDGLRVCRMLKDDPETRDISVLIFTELLAEHRAREAGADAYLRKPLDEQRFLGEIERLLGTSLSPPEVIHGPSH